MPLVAVVDSSASSDELARLGALDLPNGIRRSSLSPVNEELSFFLV